MGWSIEPTFKRKELKSPKLKKNSKCPLPLLKQALRNSCELLSQIVMELHETADMLLPSVYLKGEP